jgi:transcription elongation GreA/GreB family factor
MADLPQIYLTQTDMDRLLKLVDAQPGKRPEQLERELVRASVVPRNEIPEDVVTMNSRAWSSKTRLPANGAR